MSLTMSERVSLFVRCDNPNCGQGVEKLLAWLIIRNTMTCPNCGGAIDLQAGDNGLAIQKLAEMCASLDAALDKLA